MWAPQLAQHLAEVWYRDHVTDARTKQSANPEAASRLGGVGDQIANALAEFVVRLVQSDGGEVYLVSATSDEVHLHLAGTCAGCPGAAITRQHLLEPVVQRVAPLATLKVTTGWRVPDGAKRVAS